MKLTCKGQCWDFDAKKLGGLLSEMSSEGFDNVDAPHLVPNHMDAFTKEPNQLNIEELVAAFKVAYFLQSEQKIDGFGKELALRVSKSTYEEIRRISDYFEK